MKKGIKILLATLILCPISVYAKGSASISAAASVEVGSTVTATVTLKNTAAWNLDIKSSGSTSGCSQSFADATSNGKNTTKTLSVKCKATSTGTIGFTVSGDITSEDGESSNVSLSKRVTVIPPREKSGDANLASLSVEGYEITPQFSKDTLEYSVTVPSTVNTVKINAKVNESHASLTGTGELEVSEGMNPFEIVVTAETGVTKTYVVNVNVEDINPIEIKIANESYTLIKNAKNLIKPDLYEETTVEINGFTIPAFTSEITNFTLVGVKNAAGNINLAIYNIETKGYRIYNELKANTLTLYLIDFPSELKHYTKGTITINDVAVPVYKHKEDSRFVICYGMNIETGKYDYFSYDTKEGTFQIWNQEEIQDLQSDAKTYLYICLAFGIGFIFSFILNLCLLSKKKKQVKNKMQKAEKKMKESKQEEKEIKNEKIELNSTEENKELTLKEKLEKFDRFDNEDKNLKKD